MRRRIPYFNATSRPRPGEREEPWPPEGRRSRAPEGIVRRVWDILYCPHVLVLHVYQDSVDKIGRVSSTSGSWRPPPVAIPVIFHDDLPDWSPDAIGPLKKPSSSASSNAASYTAFLYISTASPQ